MRSTRCFPGAARRALTFNGFDPIGRHGQNKVLNGELFHEYRVEQARLAIAFTNLVRNAIDIERHGVQNSARLNALHGFLRVSFRHGVEHVVDRVVVQIERLAIDVAR